MSEGGQSALGFERKETQRRMHGLHGYGCQVLLGLEAVHPRASLGGRKRGQRWAGSEGPGGPDLEGLLSSEL